MSTKNLNLVNIIFYKNNFIFMVSVRLDIL